MPRLNTRDINVQQRLATLGQAHRERTIYPTTLTHAALYNTMPDGSHRPVFPVKRPFLNSGEARQTIGEYVSSGKGA